MKIFDNLSLTAKLALVPAIALLCFGLFAVLVLGFGSRQLTQLDTLVNVKVQSMLTTKEVSASLKAVNFEAHQLMVWGYSKYPEAKLTEKSKSVLALNAKNKEIFTQYVKTHNVTDKKFLVTVDAYSKSVIEAVDILTDDPYLASMVLMKTDKLITELDSFLAAETKKDTEFTYAFYADLKAVAVQVALILAGLFFISFTGIGALTWYSVKYLKTTASKINKIASNLEKGDFSQVCPTENTKSSDELSQSYSLLVKTVGVLRETVARVAVQSDSVGVSSHEIAEGNTDLSNRTEQHAARLQEINATLSELTNSVADIASSTQSAHQASEDTLAEISKGAEVFNTAFACIAEVENQSAKIQAITQLIDSISFQTNILALNAAIEAARAGEQGKGFAVVAAEVRALAKQVESHSKDIKELVGASAQKAHEGSAEMKKVHDILNKVVGSMSHLNAAMVNISAQSDTQKQGMNVVKNAVEYLDNSTQATAALVEQTAAAADSLRLQASGLATLTATFKTE